MTFSVESENREGKIVLQETDESLATWSCFSGISETLQDELRKANVLIVPHVGYGSREDLVYFPRGTEELLSSLRNASDASLDVDICADDSTYQEIDLHSDILRIAQLVVAHFLSPVVVDLVSTFIKQQLGRRFVNGKVISTIVLSETPTGRSIKIRYEGPAATYQSALHDALESLRTGSGSIELPETTARDGETA